MESKKKSRLTIECDEMWSYVGNKNNKYWIWLAIDVSDSAIVGASATNPKPEQGGYGILYQKNTKSVHSVIPIFGRLML